MKQWVFVKRKTITGKYGNAFGYQGLGYCVARNAVPLIRVIAKAKDIVDIVVNIGVLNYRLNAGYRFKFFSQKLYILTPDLVLAGHYGGAMGAEARALLLDSLEDSKKVRVVLEASYRRTRDVEASTQELVEIFMNKAPANFLSKDVFTVIIGQMMRYIAKSMDASTGGDAS